jgi:hypothetical protein
MAALTCYFRYYSRLWDYLPAHNCPLVNKFTRPTEVCNICNKLFVFAVSSATKSTVNGNPRELLNLLARQIWNHSLELETHTTILGIPDRLPSMMLWLTI